MYCIYYPPAPACQGPPGWEERLASHWSLILTFFQYAISSWSIFISFSMINQQLINQLLINLLFAGLQVSKLVLSTVLLYPLVHQFTLNQAGPLNFGWSWKSVKFQCISNTLENHKNGLPRPPKVTKMRSQEVPKVVKITKILKKWNLMKTSIFTILWKG